MATRDELKGLMEDVTGTLARLLVKALEAQDGTVKSMVSTLSKTAIVGIQQLARGELAKMPDVKATLSSRDFPPPLRLIGGLMQLMMASFDSMNDEMLHDIEAEMLAIRDKLNAYSGGE